MDIKASVIICSYNRAGLLSGLIGAFERQTIPQSEYELIIVNDGSTDNTDTVIQNLRTKIPNLVYIKNQMNQGLAYSANRGIHAASSDILLFTDDDCIPESDWIEKMIDSVSNTPIVCGQILSKRSPYLILARNIAEYHPVMMRNTPGFIKTIAGANMGFQRKVFTKVGDFLPGCTTPDMELLLRVLSAGYLVIFDPKCKITHYPEYKTLLQMCRYEASRSYSTIQLRNKYKELLQTPFVLQSSFLLVLLSPILAFIKVCQVFFTSIKSFGILHTLPIVFLLKIAWCIGAAKGILSARNPDTT